MSNEILNNVWKFAPCKESELLILLSLADQANDAGICWPGLQSLMKRSRVSRPTVYRAVKSLEEKGIITEIRRGQDGFPAGKFTSRVWRITPVDEWEPLMSEGDELSQFETPAPKRVSPTRQKSLTRETRTISEPSLQKTPSESYGASAVLKPINKWNAKDLGTHFRDATMVNTRSMKTGNTLVMSKFFSTKIKEGFSPVVLKDMVDIFFINWERFNAPGLEPWRIFLANTATLQDRAERKIKDELAKIGGDAYWLGD
jgi:DNA-binding transcriptional ArsR family regulator